MNVHIILPGELAPAQPLAPPPFYRSAPAAHNFELTDFSAERLPYPKELATFGEWTTVSHLQISEGRSVDAHSHLYLTDQLLKVHNPPLLFEKLRVGMVSNQHLAFRVSTAENIKNKIKDSQPFLIFRLYYLFHFVGRRVLPKLNGLRKISRLLRIPVDMSKSAKVYTQIRITYFEHMATSHLSKIWLFYNCLIYRKL